MSDSVSLGEAVKSWVNRPVMVRIRHGCVELKAHEHYWYSVGLDQCATLPQITHWVCHLADKSWVTPKMLQEFVLLATEANGLGNPWQYPM